MPKCLDAPMRYDDKSRRQVSILCPRGYEPRALTAAPHRVNTDEVH